MHGDENSVSHWILWCNYEAHAAINILYVDIADVIVDIFLKIAYASKIGVNVGA